MQAGTRVPTLLGEEALKLTQPEAPAPEMADTLIGWLFLFSYYTLLGGLLLFALTNLDSRLDDQLPTFGAAFILATSRLVCIRSGVANGWERTIQNGTPLAPTPTVQRDPVLGPRFELKARRTTAARCALCHSDADDPVACPTCQTLLHADCAVELPVCPTLGCASTTVRRVLE